MRPFQPVHVQIFPNLLLVMLAGLQIQINALHAIIPGSFIFVLDSTDRSFIYTSKTCEEASDIIFNLDRNRGIDNLVDDSNYYSSTTDEHSYMIKKLSSHIFLGFFVFNSSFSDERVASAKTYFLEIDS